MTDLLNPIFKGRFSVVTKQNTILKTGKEIYKTVADFYLKKIYVIFINIIFAKNDNLLIFKNVSSVFSISIRF